MSKSSHSHEDRTTGAPDAGRAALLARIATLEARVRELEGADAAERGPSASSASGTPTGAGTRFRALADAAPVILWLTDAQGRCTYLSRGWHDFTGQSETEGLGAGWLDAVHPDDRAEATARFREAIHHRAPFSLEHRLRRADGAYRWVIDAGRPRYDEAGRWCGHIGSVVDVHDHHLAMQALRQSELRYRTLFDSIDDGFCVLEVLFDGADRPVDYRFLETNPAFARQTGLADAIGRTARELLPELEPHWFEVYGRVARTGEPTRFENGSEAMGRWFDVYAFRVEAPEHARVALLFKDVSRQRRADIERERLLREAEAARAEAEAANRSKGEFLAAMSHELRTPLNAMGGYTELLEMGVYGPLDEAQQGAVRRIAANQRHLLRLINDILSFARIEAGRLELELQPLGVQPLVQSLDSLVAPLAGAKGVAYLVQPCDAALRLRGDAERVRQVLLNLVGNAIKFTPEGGRVSLACAADAEWVRLVVRDTGPGIPPEEHQRIFDPFQQVGRRLNQPQDGVGLGLAISRDLARAMGGDLAVESAPGEGSTFTLSLPRYADATG